jgi:hypothetical protein
MVSHREELAAQFDRHWQLAIPAAQEY